MTDAFSTTSSALPSTTRVLAFRGTEAMSTLYRFEVYLLIEDSAFDMAAALGADATLSINREDGQPYRFHGVLSTVETVAELAHGAVYRVALVPRLWQLTLTHHSRVFVDESAPGILQTVLADAGLSVNDYTFKLSASYPRTPHVCQYKESSFAFLARRMEREGMYYFFAQGEDRERLVITDDRGFHEALSADPVRYFRVSGAGTSGTAGLRSFTCRHTSIPGSVHMKDADYLRPALAVSGQATASARAEEIHLYGENFGTPEEGARLARVRADELKAKQVVLRGAGHVFFLRPGYTFKLEEHPRFDGEYLTTELSHAGNQFGGLVEMKELLGLEEEDDGGYRVEVAAIPKGAQFRPERRTHVPRIYGTERAVVDGETNSDYAQLDEHGRYLVKIHFDESPSKDGKASTRIRMMQPHGGSPESFHLPLRKGTEVMLTFEGGDPDRPVIAGVVPNLANPTLVTSKNSTKNILQTGGGNRLVMEDEKGKEYIHLSSPHHGSYLHLGSTFNPQYNKITNTAGTGLSFTSDISTSFTGTDAQTVVEDSRVTIIGRSRMAATDPLGAEIQLLTASDFINRFDEDSVLFQLLGSDAAKAQKDTKTAATAAATAAGTSPPDAGTLASMQEAIDLATTDVSTLYSDAEGFAKSPPAGYPGNPSPNAWLQQVSAASNAMSNTKKAADALTNNPSVPPTQAQVVAVQVLINTALGLVTTATGNVPTLATFALPPSPNPNVAATYINLPHHDGAVDTTSSNEVNLEMNDATAMDGAPSNGPALNPGSDVKLVGGDNVTMVAHDARSHVLGTSYGLVLTGQASVVRNGQQSKVLAPANSGAGASLFTPTTFKALSLPLPQLDSSSTIAQRSEVYGDTYAWVNGGTTSTVTSGTHTVVYSPARVQQAQYGGWGAATPLGQPWLPPLPPAPVPLPSANSAVAQASAVYGDQYSWVDGSVNGTVTGSKTTHVGGDQTSVVQGHVDSTVNSGQTAHISGGQTTWVDRQTTHISEIAFKTAMTSVDINFLMKMSIAMGIAVSINDLNLSVNVIKLDQHAVAISNAKAKIDTNIFHGLFQALHIIA